MPDLLLNIGDVQHLRLYPAHGWTTNSQNLRLLWLPVLRIVRSTNEVRSSFGLAPITTSQINEVEAFRHTVEKLALSLRELHKAVEFIRRCGGLDGSIRDEYRVEALIPIFVDSVYSYVRRLADRFANAIRFLLFRHAESAPRQYRKLRSLASDHKRLNALGPFFNLAPFTEAVDQHSNWFDLVCDSEPSDGVFRKGIRDALEHHPVIVKVARSQSGNDPWDVAAFMQGPSLVNTELLFPIYTILRDLCSLFAGLVRAVDSSGQYVGPFHKDVLFLTGLDEDATGFWPPLGADA